MSSTYGIAVVCIPINRLITDENGEQFYECMTQEELERITQEKDLIVRNGHQVKENFMNLYNEKVKEMRQDYTKDSNAN